MNVVWNELKYRAKEDKNYSNLPEVRGYPKHLNQVFANLLVNARQAMEEEGEIKITTQTINGFIEIAIHDIGARIPKENISKMFDPFLTKKIDRGMGLGLNVANNIIKSTLERLMSKANQEEKQPLS